MSYQTQREKVIEWIERGLIPKLPERDYYYTDIISGIAMDVGVTEKLVEEIIQSYIKLGKIKHENLLVATDDALKEYEKKKKEFEAEADKIVNEITENIGEKDGKNI